MRNTGYFLGKKVLVVGLARSGLACANLLFDLGSKVSVTDNQDNEIIRRQASGLKSKEIIVELGKHTRAFLEGKDLLVISPGVPINAKPIIWAKELNIPVISEIEFAWMLCAGTIIAVTGSNGKSTVTTLIGKILEASGRKVFVCGNIGNPFSAAVAYIKEGDFVSLELSSFQLETIKEFRPKVSVILNFARNHLDRHKDMQEYLDAKKRIFMNQDEKDYLVVNRDCEILMDASSKARPKKVYFSPQSGLNPNQAAVLAVGSVFSINKGLMLKVFKEFKGLEHRLEYIAQVNNVNFFNDSKATTVESCAWALNNLSGPVILIAGGKHKGVDYSEIAELTREKVKEAILIGEARERIKKALQGFTVIEEALSLKEAVHKAFLKASPGDNILLSPMCSSFDMFSNYEERGNVFKKFVYELEKEKN